MSKEESSVITESELRDLAKDAEEIELTEEEVKENMKNVGKVVPDPMPSYSDISYPVKYI